MPREAAPTGELTVDLKGQTALVTGASRGLGKAIALAFGKSDGEVFLGRDFNSAKDYSEDTARQIDAEVRTIVVGCYEHGKRLLANFLGRH